MGSISALRLGARARFEDRWSGTISAIEVTEDWQAVNVVVEGGFLLWRNSVRLPLTSATDWDDDSVSFACASYQAFGHEIPPVAVPSRPIGPETPVSAPVRIAGALVSRLDSRVREIILSQRIGGQLRIGVDDVVFEGRTLALAVQPEALSAYRADAAIRDEIQRLVREDHGLTADDKRGLRFAVEGGLVTMTGNARVENARERAAERAATVAGVIGVEDAAHDDLTLETQIGLALATAGVTHHSEVYARSSLGEVHLYGYVPSEAARDEAVRAAAAVPGVREVTSRLEIRAAAA